MMMMMESSGSLVPNDIFLRPVRSSSSSWSSSLFSFVSSLGNSPFKLVMLGAGTLAAVSGGILLKKYHEEYNDELEQGGGRKKKRVALVVSVDIEEEFTKMVGSAMPQLPSNEEFETVLPQFRAHLQQRRIPNREHWPEIMNAIMWCNLDSLSMKNLSGLASVLQLYAPIHEKDPYFGTPDTSVFYRRATQLLEAARHRPEGQRTEMQLMTSIQELELFLHLKDGDQAARRFDELMRFVPSPQLGQPKTLLHLVMQGLHLGRWETVRSKILRVLNGNVVNSYMKQMHNLAISGRHPQVIDIGVVLKLAGEHNLEDLDPRVLQWKQYKIVSRRYCFKRVQCKDKNVARQKREQFNTGGWCDVKTSGNAVLRRQGGIVRMQSWAKQPIPTFGVCSSKHIIVSGYTTTPVSGVAIRQTETYVMAKCDDDPSTFKGKYVLRQEPESVHVNSPRVEVVFYIEMTLQKL